MDIDRLQEFLMIAQKHSFKQTAQALNISEAVLSARINTLEKSIGIRLFQRNAHKVELTPKGLQFLPDATQIVDSYRQLHQRITSIRYNTYRQLRFAFSGTKMPALFGPYLDQVNLKHPDLHLELMDDQVFGIVQGLNEGLCDGFLTYGTQDLNFPQICRELLYTTQPCVLVNRFHPLANKAHISFSELNGECFALYPQTAESSLRNLEKELLEHSGITYTTYDEPQSPQFYRMLVPIGKAVVLCPWVIRDDLPPNTIPVAIDDATEMFNMYLFYRKENPNPFMPEFLAGLKEKVQGNIL